LDSTGFATAYALTTSVGLRPFLTLALASLAMHLGYLHPARSFAYLGSDGATWLLAGLAALEFLSDKVPVIDNALHVVHFATKPVAAALIVGSAIPSTAASPDTGVYALEALGGLNALGIHAGVTAVRGTSTALTLGVANPFVSLLEDGLAVTSTVFAFTLPFVAAAGAFVLSLVLSIFAWRAVVNVRARGSA
jgi:hypothetical protein